MKTDTEMVVVQEIVSQEEAGTEAQTDMKTEETHIPTSERDMQRVKRIMNTDHTEVKKGTLTVKGTSDSERGQEKEEDHKTSSVKG